VAGEQGIDLDVDNLYVKLALANDGPRMKRIRPAPMGRAYRYQRRLTHIVLAVAERPIAGGMVTKAEESKPETKAAKPKGAAPKAAKKKAAAPKAEAKAAGATKKKAAK
jgi:large subunit ribosomal protein L22